MAFKKVAQWAEMKVLGPLKVFLYLLYLMLNVRLSSIIETEDTTEIKVMSMFF